MSLDDLTSISPLPNGATSCVRSKLEAPASNQLSRRKRNGAVVDTRTGKMERIAVKTVIERDKGMVAVNGNEPRFYHQCNGSPTIQIIFNDKKTKLVVKLLFCKLCPSYEKNCGMVEREISRLHSTADKELVYRLCRSMVDLLRERSIISINLEDFIKQNWNVHAGNMYTEFSRVAYETFSDATNWGRIFVFLGFAVSFSIYLINRQVPSAADSVMEWCCQVVEEDLAKFFTANGGWVSMLVLINLTNAKDWPSREGSVEGGKVFILLYLAVKV